MKFLEYYFLPFLLKLEAKRVKANLSLGQHIRIGLGAKFFLQNNATLIISDNATIMNNSLIAVKNNAKLVIGKNSYIGPFSEIYSLREIRIGDQSLIAQKVVIIDYNHKWDNEVGVKRKLYSAKPITIGNSVWIGAMSILLPGCTISDKATIGAGSKVRQTIGVSEKFIN